MGLLLSGRQLHAFFQDARYWGRGQSFKNLALVVDGRPIGAVDFQRGWDVADVPEGAIVEIVAGIWDSRGCILPSREMPAVVECWLQGVSPLQPKSEAASKPASTPASASENKDPREQTSRSAVKRPSFSLR